MKKPLVMDLEDDASLKDDVLVVINRRGVPGKDLIPELPR
jgi:hypothetical protein